MTDISDTHSGVYYSNLKLRDCSVVRSSESEKYYFLICFYIFILHLCPVLGLLNLLPGGKPAYIVDAGTLLPILLTFYYWRYSAINRTVSYLDAAVTAYLIISVASILLYLQPDSPSDFRAYFYGIHHFVLPIFLYYAVKTFDSGQQYHLLKFTCFLNVAAILIGILLFYWRPDFYRTHLIAEFEAAGYSLEEWQVFGRMQSYLGSTALGSVIASTIILFTVLNLPKRLVAIFIPIMLLGVFLTFQRGGFIAASIAILYTFINFRGAPLFKYFMLPIISLMMLAAGLTYFTQLEESGLSRLLDKYSLESLYESADFERRGYGPGLSYLADFPMGVGLGATSSVADSMGLAARGQVVDANYMRILADLGILGLLSFFAVLWAAACAALKRANGVGWFLLFGLIAAICIGTNTLDSYYISHLFWLFLGVIDTKYST